jgi:hypothetical protein
MCEALLRLSDYTSKWLHAVEGVLRQEGVLHLLGALFVCRMSILPGIPNIGG